MTRSQSVRRGGLVSPGGDRNGRISRADRGTGVGDHTGVATIRRPTSDAFHVACYRSDPSLHLVERAEIAAQDVGPKIPSADGSALELGLDLLLPPSSRRATVSPQGEPWVFWS